MSLLLLTSAAFTALDDVGQPLSAAQLRFFRAGTTEVQHVYTDSGLGTELSDSEGYVTADAQGVFSDIYLATTWPYRVQLFDQYGRLRWDVDPYDCTCGDPSFLVFRSPVPRGDPAATLEFFATETETHANAYADPDLEVPHPNPLKANAAGIFPPVYLDDAVTYKIVRSAPALEVDPYECVCDAYEAASEVAIEVTLGDTDQGSESSVGYSDGTIGSAYGSVDSNEVDGVTFVFMITRNAFNEFAIRTAAGAGQIPGTYTTLTIEHGGGELVLDLTAPDNLIDRGGGAWEYQWDVANNEPWPIGDSGNTYTVTFA